MVPATRKPAFVEEFDVARKWKTAQPTQRPLAMAVSTLATLGSTVAGSCLRRGGAGRSGM